MKTSQLEEQLSTDNAFDEALIQENACPDLCSVINGYMNERGITRAELIWRLNIDKNYGYQLLNGTRTPTRNYLIQIGLLLKLDIEQLQRLLKTAGKKSLYVRDLFDAKVFYAIKHKMKFEQAVEFIWAESK